MILFLLFLMLCLGEGRQGTAEDLYCCGFLGVVGQSVTFEGGGRAVQAAEGRSGDACWVVQLCPQPGQCFHFYSFPQLPPLLLLIQALKINPSVAQEQALGPCIHRRAVAKTSWWSTRMSLADEG